MKRYRLGAALGSLGLLLAGLAPGLAHAHYPWLTPASHDPDAGQALEFNVGAGHHFPDQDLLDAERVTAVTLAVPGEAAVAFEVGPGTVFRTPPLTGSGPWLLSARQVSSFYSRTPQGGQRGSRAEHPDALSCGRSNNSAKALLGDGQGAIDVALGHPLEIVPLDGSAQAGGTLAVRVLLHGKPWQGTVNAVYAGFAGPEGEYPVAVSTDREGLARVPFDRAGRWLVKVSASEPFADPAVCDRDNFNSTLTLVVR